MPAKPTSAATSQPSELASLRLDVIAMNEALLLGSLHQHELTEAAEKFNAQLLLEIDERKNAEAALRASEERYRTLFNSIDEGFTIIEVLFDQNGKANDYRYLEMNPAFEKHGGLPDALGKRMRELIPDHDEYWFEAYGKVALTGEAVRFQHEARAMNRWFDVFAFRLGGSASRKVAVLFSNITERKRAEKVSGLLAAIVEYSDDAIIGKDLNSIITNWNKGAEKLFGYPAGEMVGKSIMRMIPADRQEEEKQILKKIGCGEGVEHFETLRQKKDGGLVPVSITASPIKDITGEIIGVSKVVRDITERKTTEAKIRRLNAELEQRVCERTAQLESANAELEAFSYSVSHDLRAPLRHIAGFMELLKTGAGPTLSEKNLHYLATISQATRRMGDLIDDLLAFSRVSRAELEKTDVPLAELVHETVKDFRAETTARNIQWEIHPLPHVLADPALLRLVLVNLISNAVKFTGKCPAAKIEIGESKVATEPPATVIYIRDNGAGFDPRYADKLFGVFQRLHSRDEFEGTGIGLANVQRILRRHGGRVWAEGAVDAGATFYFSIPKPNGGIHEH